MPTLYAICSAAPSEHRRNLRPRPVSIPILYTLLLAGLALWMGGCATPNDAPTALAQMTSTPAPGGSCSLSLDTPDADQAIRALINAEGELVVAQDISPLMRLWADESHVTDAKNTPDDASDDQSWRGKDAIRHRYVRTVFPGAPATTQPADLEITLDGDRATVRATTRIGDEVSPAGDRWELVQQEGCWYISGLTYNLEPKS